MLSNVQDGETDGWMDGQTAMVNVLHYETKE